MRTIGTVLGMALITMMLAPIAPPTDWPGHGLDGKAYGCTQTCDQVVGYHDAVSTADGYGATYHYKKLVWMDQRDLFNRSKINWVNHVNEDCTNDPKCDGFGPADSCDDGKADWAAYQESKTLLEVAYVDKEDAFETWEDAVGIVGVMRLALAAHCASHGHDMCDREAEEPVR